MSDEAKQRDDGRDKWATPQRDFESICEHWWTYPGIDVCAEATSTKCPFYITEEMNALRVSWFDFARQCGVKPVGWMNPPYSQPLMTAFIEKAIDEAACGFTTVFLLPSNVDQNWYHDLILDKDNVNHVIRRGRVKFEPPQGVKASSPRYGSIHGVIRGNTMNRLLLEALAPNKLNWGDLI